MTAFKDWLNGLTSKTTPVDADELYVRDSSGTPGSKKLTWANLVTTLKTAFNSLTLTGGTATASSPVLTTTQTWNNAGETFVGKSNEFTDTASASGSLLERWQLGGVSALEVIKTGIKLGNVSGYESGGTITSNSAYRAMTFAAPYANTAFEFKNFIEINHASPRLIFGNASAGTTPVLCAGVASGVIEQRNLANAQTYRLYGTYTDASNYRRLAYTMSTAGVAEIKPEGAGTGASGNVLHISGLPTSNPGAGILWNDGGTVKVGT